MFGSSRWIRPAVALLAISVFMSNAATQAQAISMDDFRNSTWNTSYVSAGGQRLSATLVLNGDSGYYDTNTGDHGDLSNVTYQFNQQGNNFQVQIRARWTMGNVSGNCRWVSGSFFNPPTLNGDWNEPGGPRGSWTGTYAGSNNPQPDPTPAPFNNPQPAQSNVSYGPWGYNAAKGYYYRTCTLPAGAHQYLIYYSSRPDWVYWYNPTSQVTWSCCPTVNNSQWGNAVQQGQDLFLMATYKARDPLDCQFPDPGDNGANFVTGSATDNDGTQVDLGCPPTDLP